MEKHFIVHYVNDTNETLQIEVTATNRVDAVAKAQQQFVEQNLTTTILGATQVDEAQNASV